MTFGGVRVHVPGGAPGDGGPAPGGSRRPAEPEALVPCDPPQLDVATLEQIAVEAGLSPAAVRQAVDELRTGRLPLPTERRRPLAPTIPAEVVVERRLDLPTDAVTRR